jgi:hypothetical protein
MLENKKPPTAALVSGKPWTADFFFLNDREFELFVFPKNSKSGKFASPARYFYFVDPNFKMSEDCSFFSVLSLFSKKICRSR